MTEITEITAKELTDALRSAGVDANVDVEMTGGHVATLYIGEPSPSSASRWGSGEPTWPCAAGPGSFNYDNPAFSTFDLGYEGALFVGPDWDDNAGQYVDSVEGFVAEVKKWLATGVPRMNPARKRFIAQYQPIYDAVARLDVHQETREQVATALTESLRGRRDFIDPDFFWLLAADPLVDCAGHDGEPCPEGRVIRVAMHDRHDEDGRSRAWRATKPTVRCVTCGARQFIAQEDTP